MRQPKWYQVGTRDSTVVLENAQTVAGLGQPRQTLSTDSCRQKTNNTYRQDMPMGSSCSLETPGELAPPLSESRGKTLRTSGRASVDVSGIANLKVSD